MRISRKITPKTVEIEKDGDVGKFTFHLLTASEEAKIEDQHREYEKVGGQYVQKPYSIKAIKAKIKKTLKEWDLEDIDTGEPIPCNPDMIDLVFETNMNLLQDAYIKAKNLEVETEQELKAEVGN